MKEVNNVVPQSKARLKRKSLGIECNNTHKKKWSDLEKPSLLFLKII